MLNQAFSRPVLPGQDYYFSQVTPLLKEYSLHQFTKAVSTPLPQQQSGSLDKRWSISWLISMVVLDGGTAICYVTVQ